MFEYKGYTIELNQNTGKFVCNELKLIGASLDAVKKQIDKIKTAQPFEPLEVCRGYGEYKENLILRNVVRNKKARKSKEYYLEGINAYPLNCWQIAYLYLPQDGHEKLHSEYETNAKRIKELERRNEEIKKIFAQTNLRDYLVKKGLVD